MIFEDNISQKDKRGKLKKRKGVTASHPLIRVDHIA